MGKSILIGNGINRAIETGGVSWNDLLQGLIADFGIPANMDKTIPFPLLFEQMVNLKYGETYLSKTRNLKKSIRSRLEGIRPNDLHSRLQSLSQYSDIITTNYDYCIEKSLDADFAQKKTQCRFFTSEPQLSMRRGYNVNGKKIWHIHGELCSTTNYNESNGHYKEESILIGFNHYAQYLKRIVENVKTGTDRDKLFQKRIIERIQCPEYSYDDSPYWVDRFYCSDVDIVGLSLDFSETHLWWLLSYRAELKSIHPELIQNEIRFFYKSDEEKGSGIRNMLRALNVNVIPLQSHSYEDFYRQMFQRLSEE